MAASSVIVLVTISAGTLVAASLHGLISAPNADAVPGARVRLFDRNSGQLHTAESGDDGRYSFLGVPDGDYLLEGESDDEALAGYRQIAVRGQTERGLQLFVSGGGVELLAQSPTSARDIESRISRRGDSGSRQSTTVNTTVERYTDE